MEKHTQTLSEYIVEYSAASVKLNLGCGNVRWKDFINIDLYPHYKNQPDSSRNGCIADCYADIRKLGLDDCSVDEIFTSHTFEHFTKWEGIDLLKDWFRMLRPRGRLVVEMPDFWRCVLWLFHPSKLKRELGRTQFYGNQWDKHEFETHRYLWSIGEFTNTLREVGFTTINASHRTETHYSWRDMRVEALK